MKVDKKIVVDAFTKGLTPHQVAEKFNITYDEVIFCISNYGKFKTSIFTKFSEHQINEIIKLCDNGEKVYKIAEIFGVDRHTISKILKRYGRKSNYSSKKFDKVRKIPFSENHKNIIIGTLLGDGCIYKQRKNTNNMYKYYLSHSKKQKEYFLWKFNNLKPFITKYYETETNILGKTHNQLKATSIAHSEFKFYADMFYDNNVKIIPKNIALFLNPITMAIWFMDDGSLNRKSCEEKGYGLRICSLNFTYKDHIILKDALKICFNINVKIGAYNRNDKKYYYINFNKRNSWLLKNIIDDYVIDSMKYKLNLKE